MSDTQRISALERQVGELKEETRRLRLRMEHMLSRKGGALEGQLHIDGWIQLVERSSITTPASDLVRICAFNSGGVLQLIAVFPSGKTEVLGQE